MMKGKIVLVRFPFDDLSSTKLRPAVCLTNPVGEHQHIILAFITSKNPTDLRETDIVLDSSNPDFSTCGLNRTSTIRLDRAITLRKSMILRELGKCSAELQTKMAEKLCQLLKQE